MRPSLCRPVVVARRPLEVLGLHLVATVVRVTVAGFPVGPVQLLDQPFHLALENGIWHRLQARSHYLQFEDDLLLWSNHRELKSVCPPLLVSSRR